MVYHKNSVPYDSGNLPYEKLKEPQPDIPYEKLKEPQPDMCLQKFKHADLDYLDLNQVT